MQQTMPIDKKSKVAVMASGAGTTAEAIIVYGERDDSSYQVAVVISNNSNTEVRRICERRGIPFHHLSSHTHPSENELEKAMLLVLESYEVSLVALAGYMKLFPVSLLSAKRWIVINTHPSLLPKYGGQGMYGIHVHKKVLANRELFSGFSVHRVEGEYDKGEIIWQREVRVLDNDDEESLAARIKALEREEYPQIIDKLCKAASEKNIQKT